MAVPSTSHTALLTGVRALLTCDSGEVVKGILEFVLSQRRSVRLLRRALRGAETTSVAIVVMLLNAVPCYTGVALIKPTAFVINSSRGPVIDERAREVALAEGRLAGAALDVFEEEPLPASSLLRAIPNCWLAPHNANSSVAAAERVHERTLQSLLDAP